MALDHLAHTRFLEKFKDHDGILNIEVGYVKSTARGKNVGSRAGFYLGKWLIENMNMKCMYFHLVGMYALRPLLEQGFRLEFTNYYDEFEFEGKKVFEKVKPSKYFYEPNRPGSYLVSIYREDILKKEAEIKRQRPRL